MFCHAQFGREPANDISALLFGICPLFSGSQGYLVFWPKNLDSLRVLVPHAVVQSVCSFGARFQENRDKKKITKMCTLYSFPLYNRHPSCPSPRSFIQILRMWVPAVTTGVNCTVTRSSSLPDSLVTAIQFCNKGGSQGGWR